MLLLLHYHDVCVPHRNTHGELIGIPKALLPARPVSSMRDGECILDSGGMHSQTLHDATPPHHLVYQPTAI